MRLIHLDPIGSYPAILDVLLMRQLGVPLLQPDSGGVVGLNHLLEGSSQLLPAGFRILPQFLDGGKHNHGVLNQGIHINHLPFFRSLLQLSNASFQMIIL